MCLCMFLCFVHGVCVVVIVVELCCFGLVRSWFRFGVGFGLCLVWFGCFDFVYVFMCDCV